MNNQSRLQSILFVLRKKKVLIGLPITLIVIGIIYITLIRFGIIKDPFPLPNIPFLQPGPKVSIKTEYKNPFDKKTQYVNPFDTYKNPFVVAK